MSEEVQLQLGADDSTELKDGGNKQESENVEQEQEDEDVFDDDIQIQISGTAKKIEEDDEEFEFDTEPRHEQPQKQEEQQSMESPTIEEEKTESLAEPTEDTKERTVDIQLYEQTTTTEATSEDKLQQHLEIRSEIVLKSDEVNNLEQDEFDQYPQSEPSSYTEESVIAKKCSPGMHVITLIEASYTGEPNSNDTNNTIFIINNRIEETAQEKAAIAMHNAEGNLDFHRPKDDLEIKAEQEWATIEALRSTQVSPGGVGLKPLEARERIITFHESWHSFAQQDMSVQKARLASYNQTERGLKGLIRKVALNLDSIGLPRMKNEALNNERDLVFCITLTPLDHNNELHSRIITSVYKKLTGDKLSCPPVGRHWEIIGFQGSDPSTDLRGVGMFGLLQLLSFIGTANSLAMEMYHLSKDTTQEFPFCVVGLQMTARCLELLRDGKLTKYINKESSVIKVINDLYMGLMVHMYRLWKAQACNIHHYDRVKKEIAAYSQKHVKDLIAEFHQAVSEKERINVDGKGGFVAL